MHRRLNVRLLVISLAIVVGVGVVVHLVHLWQVDRNAKSLLIYARDAASRKKIDVAESIYGQYLKMAPRDYDVQEELANLISDNATSYRRNAEAVYLYEGLLLKSPDRPAARMRLIENLILLGQYDAAVRNLEILRPSASDPADIDHRRGWCLDADGKHAAAALAFRNAVKLDPKRVASWLLLAEVLHHRLSRDEEALAALDEMIAANPESAAARLGRFHYYRLVGRDADAEADLAEAQKIAPDDAAVLLTACQWAQQRGDFARARDLVDRGAKLFPANEAMIRELAALELREGHRDRALAVLEDGIRAVGAKTTSGELQVFRADLLIDAGKTAEAADVVAQLRKQGLSPALPDFLEARLLMDAEKWRPAQRRLENAAEALKSDPYWTGRISALLGVCYGQQGDVDRQIAALLTAARSEPRWAALNSNLGQAYLAAGDPQQALRTLEPLADDPKAPPGTRTLLADALFRLALQRPPRDRSWTKVDEAIARAKAADPGSFPLVLLKARVLEAQGKLDDARRTLTREIAERMIAAKPESLPAWIALADLESRSGDFERSENVLVDARKRFGDQAAIRLARARLLSLRGKTGDRDALRKLADDTDSLSPEDRGRLHRDLAEIWLQRGDSATARTLLVKAADELPRDLRVRSLLIDLDLQDGKLDDARRWRNQIADIEGAGGAAAAFASLAIDVEQSLGNPDGLKKRLADLKNSPLRRGDGRVELLEARILEKLGDQDRALSKLLEAAYAGQRSPKLLHRLVKLLSERQEYDQLSWVIAQIEGKGPTPRDVGRAAIETAVARGNLAEARDLLGPIDVDVIRDHRELLWLGRTFKSLGEPVRAESAFRRAVAVAPHAVDAWLALADELLATGQRSRADALISDIEKKTPAKYRELTTARVEAALGHPKQAADAFRRALTERPNDFLILLAAAEFAFEIDDLDQARRLFEKILAPTMPTPAEIAARARRGLAASLAASNPGAGLTLLQANFPRGDIADQRLQWFLQSHDPAQRSAALKQFEASLSRGPFTPEETFWLAQMHDAAGQTTEASTLLDRLIADHAATPRMLAYYADSLLRRGQPADARRIVDLLRLREPDSPRVRDLQSRTAR